MLRGMSIPSMSYSSMCMLLDTVKLDRCRSRLSSIVTSTTMEKCNNVIKKVRESRFIKVRDRQVNKFNRLLDNKNREFNTQPLANTAQPQAQNNPNKWVINLSSTPLSQAQEFLLCKGSNYAISPQNPPT